MGNFPEMYPEWKWGVRWGEKMMRERWSDSYCVCIFRPLSPCKYPPYYPHIINAKKITFDGGKLCAPFALCAFPVFAPPLPVRPRVFPVNRSPLSLCLILRPFPFPFPYPFHPLTISPTLSPFARSLIPCARLICRIYTHTKTGGHKTKTFLYIKDI